MTILPEIMFPESYSRSFEVYIRLWNTDLEVGTKIISVVVLPPLTFLRVLNICVCNLYIRYHNVLISRPETTKMENYGDDMIFKADILPLVNS